MFSMHYLMAVTSMKSTLMKSTHREVDKIDFSIYVRKTSKCQIKCSEYFTCHKIMYLFCTVALFCYVTKVVRNIKCMLYNISQPSRCTVTGAVWRPPRHCLLRCRGEVLMSHSYGTSGGAADLVTVTVTVTVTVLLHSRSLAQASH